MKLERVPSGDIRRGHHEGVSWLGDDEIWHRMENGYDVSEIVCQACVQGNHRDCEHLPHEDSGYSLCPCNVALGCDYETTFPVARVKGVVVFEPLTLVRSR